MKLLLVLFVAAAFSATGEALECYTCRWPKSGCEDPFDESAATKTKCPTQPNLTSVCSKYIGELSNGTTGTIRACDANLSLNPQKSLDRADSVTLKSVTIHYCSSDLCNGVSTTSAALSMLIVLALPFIFRNLH